MYWTFKYDGTRYASWGEPRLLDKNKVIELEPRFDVQIYSGAEIKPEDMVSISIQGSGDLGMGDSIWLVSFMRDIYRIKARRRCDFRLVSSDWLHNFYRNFLPKSFVMQKEYMTEKEFMSCQHKLPAMYYWHDSFSSDKSWVDNRSLVERLYNWTGMAYDGLPDWGEFTNQEILYPRETFWKNLGLNKKDKYVFFQWHSSGHTKNLPPATNIKLLKHIVKKYGYKVYVMGRLKCLDILDNIPGVVNLSGKTEGNAEALFTLAFNSEFVVAPDSAGIHLAEAYKIPCVGLMATLPPVYIASKYKIPAFMFGSGKCMHSPCGIVHQLPKDTKCPPGTKDYCRVFDDIDLDLFDRCVEQSFKNRRNYRSEEPLDFYQALKTPISLSMV